MKAKGVQNQPMQACHHTEATNETVARTKSDQPAHLTKGAPADRADDLVPLRLVQGVRLGQRVHGPLTGLWAPQQKSPITDLILQLVVGL